MSQKQIDDMQKREAGEITSTVPKFTSLCYMAYHNSNTNMLVRKQGPSRLTHQYNQALIHVATARGFLIHLSYTSNCHTIQRVKRGVSRGYFYCCIPIGYGCDIRKYQLRRNDIHV